jgi:hypothetical protein
VAAPRGASPQRRGKHRRFKPSDDDSPSLGGDLSRLGNGERNLAKPKVARRPSERARASQRRGEGELFSGEAADSGRDAALRRPPALYLGVLMVQHQRLSAV